MPRKRPDPTHAEMEATKLLIKRENEDRMRSTEEHGRAKPFRKDRIISSSKRHNGKPI
jgi:hypothetical protein